MSTQSVGANNPILDQQGQALASASRALREFRAVFGDDLTPAFWAERYVEKILNLKLARKLQAGFDATDSDGVRYEIKLRKSTVLNIDVNSFDFDYLVLVNLDDSYQPVGIWKMTREQAETIFARREKFRKWQCTQNRFKSIASEVTIPIVSQEVAGGTLESNFVDVVSVSPDVQSGVPVFAGTRVPVQNLLDYLSGGDSIDEFVIDFPSVSRDQIAALLGRMGQMIIVYAKTREIAA